MDQTFRLEHIKQELEANSAYQLLKAGKHIIRGVDDDNGYRVRELDSYFNRETSLFAAVQALLDSEVAVWDKEKRRMLELASSRFADMPESQREIIDQCYYKAYLEREQMMKELHQQIVQRGEEITKQLHLDLFWYLKPHMKPEDILHTVVP